VVLLAALSLVAVIYQIRFSGDVVQVLWRSNEIARLPFEFQTPPTVYAVQPEAAAVGVQKGDQLLAVNGQTFRGIVTLARAVGSSRPGEMLTVTVLRPHGRTQEARIVTIRLSAEWQQGLKRETWLLIFVLELLLPAICLLLGIGVAAIRPMDRLAWLLLVLMLGFTQLISPHWLAGWGSLVRYPAEIYHRIFRMAWPIGMMLWSAPQNGDRENGDSSRQGEHMSQQKAKRPEYGTELKLAAVRRVLAGDSVRAVAQELGIRRKRLYVWKDRYAELGEAGLARRRGGRPRKPAAVASEAGPAGRGELLAARRRIAELERKVGQQELELDFFGEALRRIRVGGKRSAH
jgi:transposase-like protein